MTQLGNLETTVSGKIESINSNSGVYYTAIVAPAVDAYSFPVFVRIRSKKPLGRQGDEIVDVHCRVSGWKRSFDFINKQTQMKEKGVNYDQILDAVE